MSNQLFHNDHGLRSYGASRYEDLSREAESERLARLAGGDKSRQTAALAPVSVALTLLLVAAWIVL